MYISFPLRACGLNDVLFFFLPKMDILRCGGVHSLTCGSTGRICKKTYIIRLYFFSDGANSFDLARDERNIDNIQSTLYFIRCIREGFLIIMHCLKHLPTPVWGSAHLKG